MNTRHLSGLAGEVEMRSGEGVTHNARRYLRRVAQPALRADISGRARQV